MLISADNADKIFPDFYSTSLIPDPGGGGGSNRSKLCVKPLADDALRPSSEGTVVERVGLPLLYSSGSGELRFDCRHLQDGRVYSARLTAQLPASPVLGTSPKFTVSLSFGIIANKYFVSQQKLNFVEKNMRGFNFIRCNRHIDCWLFMYP